MAMQFNSINAFCAHLTATILSMEAKEAIILEEMGVLVEKKAKDIIGQEDVQGLNGFASHDPLADSTVQFKEDHGFTGRVSETDPLLRTGDMRDSITHELDLEHKAVLVGSPLQEAVWMELGTSRAPPRSFLGIGAEQSREELEQLGIKLAVSIIKP